MANHMRSEPTIAALRMVIARQRPEPGVIAHSDRESQYVAAIYRAALTAIGARPSMSRKRALCDNAPMENFKDIQGGAGRRCR